MSSSNSPATSGRSGLGRVSRTAIADAVYDRIKALLMDNAFEPGARLTTDYLADELGVSRTPVRESLARLATEGLLVKQPMIGYSVRPLLDRNGLEELYAVRLLLEPAAARLAATNGSDAQLAALGPSRLRAAPSSRARYQDYRAFVADDAAFHEGVAAASGNTLLREVIGGLRSHVHTYRLWAHAAATPIEAMREHAAVVNALRKRDAPAAEAAMRAHLDGALVRLRTAFEPQD